MIVVVTLQRFLIHRDKLAQATLHLLELFRVVGADVRLERDRLDGTVITEVAFVRLGQTAIEVGPIRTLIILILLM